MFWGFAHSKDSRGSLWRFSGVRHSKDSQTILRGFSEVGHSGFSDDSLQKFSGDSLGILWGGHSRDSQVGDCLGLGIAENSEVILWASLGLGTSGSFRGWVPGHARVLRRWVSEVGHSCRGTPGSLWGWALQGVSGILLRWVLGDQAETGRGVVAEFHM